MKYFGEKSLSSVTATLLQVGWWVVVTLGVVGSVIGTAIILAVTFGEPAMIQKEFSDFQGEDWETFMKIPFALKIMILPYAWVALTFLLKILKRARLLFSNFKNNLVFTEANVDLIANIGKLSIWLSILTFDLGTLFASLLILLLSEIFKNGAQLQQEHDLTV